MAPWLAAGLGEIGRSGLEMGAEAPQVHGLAVLGRLGEGGAGEVWLVWEEMAERAAALKLLTVSQADLGREWLRREARLLAGLSHPHLTRWLGAVETVEGRPGALWEWIDGPDLAEWCAGAGNTVGPAARLEMLLGIVSAVACLHDHGVIHRDLKPANILVSKEGIAKLVDFGLAQEAEEPGVAAGTRRWMAPEQALSAQRVISASADVYALGWLMVWALTGQEPPARPEAARLPPPPKDLPADVWPVLRRACAADPARRYRTAGELADEFTRITARRPVLARQATWPYLFTLLLRRQARRTALAAGLVVLGLVLGGWLWLKNHRLAIRNEANLRSAYFLTDLSLRELRDDLRRTGAVPGEQPPPLSLRPQPGENTLPPLDASGRLDLRYYEALLNAVRAATAEGQARPQEALHPASAALDLFSALAREAPADPRRLYDAAHARLAYVRLLYATCPGADAVAEHATKVLAQIGRIPLLRHNPYSAQELLILRAEALSHLAGHAASTGHPEQAVAFSKDHLIVLATLHPRAPAISAETTPVPALAAAAERHLAYARAAGGEIFAQAGGTLRAAVAAAQARHLRQPEDSRLRLTLALTLMTEAKWHAAVHPDATDDLPLFDKAASLLFAQPNQEAAATRPHLRELGLALVSRIETLLPRLTPHEERHTVELGHRLLGHVRKNGDDHPAIILTRARLYLLAAQAALTRHERATAAHQASLACAHLRFRQARNPDDLPLAALTLEALHFAAALSDEPAAQWTEAKASHLRRLHTQLSKQGAQLTASQQQILADGPPVEK